jgi:ABC-2 type transport system ATP-binding protein
MLTLDNIQKKYGRITAVDGLSLTVARGEVLGLLGPNGAGKSTTVNLAVGLLAPDLGRVTIDGAGDPRDPAVRKRIGVAPQALALYDVLTGQENLRFFGEVYGLAGRLLTERVAWSLDFVGLTDRARDRLGTYSGGMKRRLNLASALVHDPDLILLDEPTVGVDPQSRNQIFENILALKRLGRTLIYTTHYMEEAERLCDRVAVIDKGRLLALGSVSELLTTYRAHPILVAHTDRGEERIETSDPLGALNRLAAAGRVSSFHMERATLEQVFLHLTGRSLRD